MVRSCGRGGSRHSGTEAERAALFEEVVAKTLAREALSPVKNQKLGLDPEREMRRLRDEFLTADTDERLFYALARLSNARRDRHLQVTLVPGGLRLLETAGLEMLGGETPAPPQAPLLFATDYGAPERFF